MSRCFGVVYGCTLRHVVADGVKLRYSVRWAGGLTQAPSLFSLRRRFVSTEKPKPKLFEKENIYTIPNILTTSRLIMSPIIGYFIVSHQMDWALGFLATAAVTDVLDGFIARRYNQKTYLGSALDPAADKVLMTLNTFLQLALMGFTVGASAAGIPMDHVALESLRWTVTATTIGSAAAYAFNKDLVRFISEKKVIKNAIHKL
ncbi:hypothetical protein HDV05_007757 [Chytridiales sp. JEL 0842]|nr:hypothetical protein HDV05_007757 [Chytridiales sp. JEL 0842]